ncbi:MAG TPA: hypothetical protein VE944_26700 [Nostoc sp.]|uniref:hypothetical protein n=1 Tax=Nostoc sp. TaxID=1180 RepID=UPI002D494D0D|nr:hypothetical protein [Nostoc sp.]HYX17885.1 hypothetical protein [Nostoc sp.]
MSKHLNLWQDLNLRQQLTLSAIYHADQKAEDEEGARWRLGWQKRPAAVWRSLRYPDLNGRETFLHKLLRESEVIDEGLGSTLQALERRQLCECNYYQVRGKSELLSVKLTTTGRAVVRAGLGKSAPKKTPKGQLRPRQWEALCTAYQAGESGLDSGLTFGDYAGFSWQWTWLRLRDYKGGGLVRKVGYWKDGKHLTKLIITEAGIKFYQKQWSQYLTLYPDVNAPKPE